MTSEAVTGADLRHIDTWIFDLDNTLYQSSTNLFLQIELRMTEFIALHLDIHPGEAYALQHFYFRSYGSTLRGLMQCDAIDPEEFLAYVHEVDLSPLDPEPRLRPALERLPGRRFVLTNSCRNYADRVLDKIGLTGLWDGIWDIRTLGYEPKPRPGAYERIVEVGRFAPKAAAMFEDTARNLVPAFRMGMTTVFLNSASAVAVQGPEVSATPRHNFDFEITDLAQFLQTIQV
jgi:putative hydrolase of the HAD superfamily